MTKKDFIALADKLRQMKPVYDYEFGSSYSHGFADGEARNYQFTIECLASFCLAQNSSFNCERWLGYIAGANGPNGGTL